MIPIAKPFLGEEEALAAQEAIMSGWVTQGPRVKAFEDAFAQTVGARCACAVSNCTAALHLALIVVGVKPGDVVITVSHSFIATANAVRNCGAEPVFLDINKDTLNMSPEALEKCLHEDCEIRDGQLFYREVGKLAVGESPLCSFYKNSNINVGRVASIMPVHQMGMPCDLKAILNIAKRFKLPVIEDAACAVGSEILISKNWEKIGKPHGDIACFSFHPRKIITVGDGGMLTTNNANFDLKFRLLRQHGMSISDAIRHNTKKVVFEEYVTTGYNYRMTDIQGAIGIQQLKKLDKIITERNRIANTYRKQLESISWLDIPNEPEFCRTNWQSFAVYINKNAPVSRDELIQKLLDAGISTRRGIMNAHQEKTYGSSVVLENSETARDTIILLPIYYGLDEADVNRIIQEIKNVG